MSGEIATRQLLAVAKELEAEGCSWTDFLDAENIDPIDIDDPFARIDWDHYVRAIEAASRHWDPKRLEDIAARSLHLEATSALRDSVALQCDNLDQMMGLLFGPDGMFHNILLSVQYKLERVGRREWHLDMIMKPGYALSEAHCHFGIGVLRELPSHLYENRAEVSLELHEDRAHYRLRVPGWSPWAFFRRRFERSLPNRGLADRLHDAFAQLAIRQLQLQAEAERRAQVEAELAHVERLEALGRLTGGVAHDFNNLLTVIQGQLELISLDATDPKVLERVGVAAQAADKGARLTRQLLAFGRRAALRPESTNANAVIEDMAPMLTSTLGETVDVRSMPATDLANTMVDRGQLETALLNLAINARDAMPDGGTLILETQSVDVDEKDAAQHGSDLNPGPYVVVAVSDTGQGMSPDVLEHAFEPFFSTKEASAGTGLGLSMVWGFLQQSGGTARIRSKVGGGTTVQLYFPEDTRESTAGVTAEPRENIQAPHASPRVRVLVVEDEEDVRRIVVDMLLQLGYEVESAADGETALAALRNNRDVALLLTDVVLPGGMSGPEVAAAAQAIVPTLPVAYMSGYPEAGAINTGSIGPNDILLSKPFSYADLGRTLRTILSLPEAGNG
jgi:signal transduction histidine kinase/ActR/RegA family two-component response regulator